MLLQHTRTKTVILNLPLVVLGLLVALCIHFIPLVQIKEGYYSLMVFAFSFLLIQLSLYNRKYESFVRSVILGMLIFLIVHFLYHLAVTYKVIEEWDFLCFYVFGKVGIKSSDFYNPQIFSQTFNELDLQGRVGANFSKEIVDVGFWYPPPSMFLFLLLGALDLQTGYIIWQTIFIGLLLIDVYLLIKYFGNHADKQWKNISLVCPIFLIMLFPNVTASITYGQIISLFLFLLICVIYNIDNWKAGIFLAILVIVKPLAALFFLYFLFFRKWKILLTAAVTGALILLLTVLFFGIDPLFAYFKSPPTARIPDFVYSEYYSLFGFLKRLQDKFPAYLSEGTLKLINYAGSLVLIGITFFASRKLYRLSPVMAFMVFIPMALMVYPATLNHYSIMTLPVFLYIFNQKEIKENRMTLAFIFLLFGIGYYSFFLYNLILWVILITWPMLLNFVNKNYFSKKTIKQLSEQKYTS